MKKIPVSTLALFVCTIALLQTIGCAKKDDVTSIDLTHDGQDTHASVISLQHSNAPFPEGGYYNYAAFIGFENLFVGYVKYAYDTSATTVFFDLDHPNSADSVNSIINWGAVTVSGQSLVKYHQSTPDGVLDYVLGLDRQEHGSFSFAWKKMVYSIYENLQAPTVTFTSSGSPVVNDASLQVKTQQNVITNIANDQVVTPAQDFVVKFSQATANASVIISPYIADKYHAALDTVSGGYAYLRVDVIQPTSTIVIPKEEIQKLRQKWTRDVQYVVSLQARTVADTLHLTGRAPSTKKYNIPVVVDGQSWVRILLKN